MPSQPRQVLTLADPDELEPTQPFTQPANMEEKYELETETPRVSTTPPPSGKLESKEPETPASPPPRPPTPPPPKKKKKRRAAAPLRNPESISDVKLSADTGAHPRDQFLFFMKTKSIYGSNRDEQMRVGQWLLRLMQSYVDSDATDAVFTLPILVNKDNANFTVPATICSNYSKLVRVSPPYADAVTDLYETMKDQGYTALPTNIRDSLRKFLRQTLYFEHKDVAFHGVDKLAYTLGHAMLTDGFQTDASKSLKEQIDKQLEDIGASGVTQADSMSGMKWKFAL
jgi:hypothetical protein